MEGRQVQPDPRGLVFNPGRDEVVVSYYVHIDRERSKTTLGGPCDPASVQRMVAIPPNDGMTEGCRLILRSDGVFIRSTGP